MSQDVDLAVVGAGPAGSSAAEAAAAAGISVWLIDKKSEIGSPVQCGGFLPDAGELEKLLPSAELPGPWSISPNESSSAAPACREFIRPPEASNSFLWPAGF